MGLKDVMHKFTRRWNATHSKIFYDERRGIFENDEGMPAGHSGKIQTLISPVGAVFPNGIVLPNVTDIAYITMAQFSFVTIGGNERIDLRDSGANIILSSTAINIGDEHNETKGDGSAVIASFQGQCDTIVSHSGGAPPAECPILLTYYIRPVA